LFLCNLNTGINKINREIIMGSITEFLNDNEEIWWNPQHPTYHAHEGRPSCQNCGKPADMNNKYTNGKIKWRDMCYDCHDHRTDKNYLATKFVGTSLPI
jgi:hypothetical protein